LKTVYNVYFRHRGIPAKFLYAATDWTFWKDTQWGKPYETILNLHRELGIPLSHLYSMLGDVIRIQPNEVVFNTTAALEDIYGHNTKTDKTELYSLMVPKGYNASIATELYFPLQVSRNNCFRDKPRHAFLRRLISPSFSPTALKMLELTMNTYYEEFISGVGKRAAENNGIVELNEWFHNLSFDVRISHNSSCHDVNNRLREP
jgi:cytochrome P450